MYVVDGIHSTGVFLTGDLVIFMGRVVFESKHLRPQTETGMIWTDDWIEVATTRDRGTTGPYCTLIPPPRPTIPAGFRFEVFHNVDAPLEYWIPLVGTKWTTDVVRTRLQDAWVAYLWYNDGFPAEESKGEMNATQTFLMATCVLRPQKNTDAGNVQFWILESLVVEPGLRGRGCGALLCRAVMSWIWDYVGPFILGFTWELSAAALAIAAMRGRLQASAAIHGGWIFTVPEYQPRASRYTGLIKITTPDGGHATVTDSGLRDHYGYVLDVSGEIPWAAVAKKGGWQHLWMHSATCPGPEWKWTREFVVIGFLNANQPMPHHWITTEIACGTT
jgi:hypothetical protein